PQVGRSHPPVGSRGACFSRRPARTFSESMDPGSGPSGGVFDMIAFGWVRIVQQFLSKKKRPSRRRPTRPRATIQVERLEGHILLSAVHPVTTGLHAHQEIGRFHPAWNHRAQAIPIRHRMVSSTTSGGTPAGMVSAAQTTAMPTQTITQVVSAPAQLT